MKVEHKFVGEFAEVVKTDDGTLIVKGVCTSPAVDSDNEVCDPDWLRTAVPAWMKAAGNMREMHSGIAAGIGIEVSPDDADKWWLTSEAVDPGTILKIDKKVLKGYSVGISNVRRAPHATLEGVKSIVGGDIVEISYVDRPANPDCIVEVVKFDRGLPVLSDTAETIDKAYAEAVKRSFTQAERDEAASNGHAMKDGSYVIDTAEDLDNAIHAVGRGKGDHDAIRKHIIKRAKALGASDKVPANWNPDGSIDAADKAAKADDAPHVIDARDGQAPTTVPPDPAPSDVDAAGVSPTPAASGAGAPLEPDGGERPPLAPMVERAVRAIALKFTRAHPDKATKAMLLDALATKDATPQQPQGGWLHDPQECQQVRSLLVGFIIGELQELVNGEREMWDVQELCDALCTFMWWWQDEAYEGETIGPYDQEDYMFTSLGVDPDVIKAAKADDAPEAAKAALRAAAVKALFGVDTDVDALRQEVAEIKQLAIMSAGPAVTKTGQGNRSETATKIDQLESNARASRDRAATVTDPTMKRDLLESADDQDREAHKLRGELVTA